MSKNPVHPEYVAKYFGKASLDLFLAESSVRSFKTNGKSKETKQKNIERNKKAQRKAMGRK
jgi:hypothetical protein